MSQICISNIKLKFIIQWYVLSQVLWKKNKRKACVINYCMQWLHIFQRVCLSNFLTLAPVKLESAANFVKFELLYQQHLHRGSNGMDGSRTANAHTCCNLVLCAVICMAHCEDFLCVTNGGSNNICHLTPVVMCMFASDILLWKQNHVRNWSSRFSKVCQWHLLGRAKKGTRSVLFFAKGSDGTWMSLKIAHKCSKVAQKVSKGSSGKWKANTKSKGEMSNKVKKVQNCSKVAQKVSDEANVAQNGLKRVSKVIKKNSKLLKKISK